MKYLFSVTLLLSCISPCFAQFAKIVDRDGYVNLREKADSKSKIIGRIKSDEIVYISDKGNDSESWALINYQHNKDAVFSKYISGYVHHSRLQKISSFLNIPWVDTGEDEINFLCCGVEVEIKTKKFDYESNKNSFKKWDGYYTYKGKYAFGALGRFPLLTSYKSIYGMIGNIHFEIPSKEIENLFSVNNELSECYYDKKSNTLYILLNNADGSDAYNALLIIEGGKYKRIIVDDDH